MTELEQEYDEIQKKLVPLYRRLATVTNSVRKYTTRAQEIKEELDLEYSKKIPSDHSKITNEQWAWILKAGGRETKVQYAFHKRFFKSMYRNGYAPETEQIAFCLPFYNLNKEEVLAEFSILVKHLKSHTFSDKNRRGEYETGIRFQVNDLCDGTTGVVYIHSDESVTLYASRNAPRQDFKDFLSFIDWYSLRLSKHKDDDQEDD
jgi:hypothetical protein